jgi:hypothetical protein
MIGWLADEKVGGGGGSECSKFVFEEKKRPKGLACVVWWVVMCAELGKSGWGVCVWGCM